MLKFVTFAVIAFLCTLFFAQSVLAAKPDFVRSSVLVLTENVKEYPLGKQIEYCEDAEHRFTIDDFAKQTSRVQGKFRRSDKEYLNFLYSRSAYWLRFTVKNSYPREEVFLLECAYPNMDTLAVYRPDSAGQYALLLVGDMQNFSAREIPHRNHICRIRLRPGEEMTVYMRIANGGPLIAPFTLWQSEEFLQKEYWENALHGAYYGIVLVMCAYNLLLAFAVRDKSYLYYVATIGIFAIYQMCLDGNAAQYLWQTSNLWSNRAYLFFSLMAGLSAALFSRSYLSLPTVAPFFNRSTLAFMVLSACLAILTFFVPYRNMIPIVSGFVACAALNTLLSGIYCAWRGYKPSYYFLVAWTALITSIVFFTLIGFGFVPYTYWTWHGSRFGAVLEAVLLSLGLAYRINLLRQDQEKAQTLERENSELALLNSTLGERNVELQRTNQKLDEANTFKTRMVSIVSHDLKNPINTMRLLAESLRSEIRSDSEDGRENLRLLITETHHSSKMVEELLDMAALDMGKMVLKPREMDFSALTMAVVFMQSPVAEKKGQSIKMHLPPECVIIADEARIRQVVENLISNAIKFSPHDTIIWVDLEAPTPDLVRFSVKDEGQGFSEEDKSKLFGHFQKLSARPTGGEHSSGIGLAIVKQIVELHKGTVRVESELGKGACFVVELPKK